MNAIELLKEDHKEALDLIGKLEAAGERPGTDPTHTENFNRLKEVLKLHSKLEEEFLYPIMEEIEETFRLIDEAYWEHKKIDELLAQLSAKAPNQKEFQELLVELRSSLEYHIKKEEEELFPEVEENMGQREMNDISERIQKMKRDPKAAAAAVRRR
jgi:iron-sulfur cluster repair protein YtfE (RIC family)